MGCAGRQSATGGYQSTKGYRVTLPGEAWRAVADSRADLELRHQHAQAAILVNAACQAPLAHRSVSVLTREILAGFSGREVHEREVVSLAGREAEHVVVEGHDGPSRQRVRVELYVARDERCVYDLLYAATPEDFAVGRADFRTLVGTFTVD